MKTKITTKTSTFVLAILAPILCGTTIGTAAPGDLDPTFGSGGKINISIYAPLPTRTRIQPDGKIVTVAGYEYLYGDSFITRHNANGTPDATFGDGVWQIGMTYFNEPVSLTDFVIMPDGKYFAVGYSGSSPNRKLALFRLTANGILEETMVWTGVAGGTVESFGDRIALQPDGKIVAAGHWGASFLLVRYHPNGTLDTGFGTNGSVIYGLDFVDYVNEVLLQSDGKIIIVGSVAYVGTVIVRVNPDGTIDDSFYVETGLRDLSFVGAALQTDGKIVVCGRTYDASSAIKRYNPNGTPDNSFGVNGTVSISDPQPNPYATGIARTLAIQSNGKIIIAGTRNGKFTLSRYRPNGAIDPTFGTNGWVITTFLPNSTHDSVRALAVQPDGKIIAAGNVLNAYEGSGMARYLSGPEIINRTPFDFDGDGRADLSVFRPSDRTWYLNQSTNGFFATQFGLAADRTTPADFDGDGRTDIAVFRDGTWYWLNSSDGNFSAIQFGLANDIPVPADYTGDGRAELAVYRDGVWWTLDLTNNQAAAIQFGISTDKPVVADYDGDGHADQAVYRGNGEWHLNRSTQGYTVINFGLATDKPVTGDYDGDGKTDVAVYRDGTWYLLRSQLGFAAFQWGIATDIPAPADYDGDGRTDAVVFRNGTWYLLQSIGGISFQQFGLKDDKPVPAAFLEE